MLSSWRGVALVLLLAGVGRAAVPNETTSNAIEVKQALDRLRVTGSVLIIGAHPDDENTALISYLALGRKVRTAYLSLTRGEGGQNVIGPEQGSELGVIRTEELLRSRAVDGAQQFFTRAIDFGYSKSSAEAIGKWGHDAVLSDMVWIIRRFRPEVIILQFLGDAQHDGHGQHSASAILGREAFTAAADAKRFPEQLSATTPWQATRLVTNRRGFTKKLQAEIAQLKNKIDLSIGEYDPAAGYSYGELAGISRSFNRSQNAGTGRPRGEVTATLQNLAGPPATRDLFDGIDVSWNRFPGGGAIQQELDEAVRFWTPGDPVRAIGPLSRAAALIGKLPGPEAALRLGEVYEAIAACAGLWLDASTDRQQLIWGQSFPIKITAIRRTAPPVTLRSLTINEKTVPVGGSGQLDLYHAKTLETQGVLERGKAYTQPYWLLKDPAHDLYQVDTQQLIGSPRSAAPLALAAELTIGEAPIRLVRPVRYRYLDVLRGESIDPVALLPPVDVRFPTETELFPNERAKTLSVEVQSHIPQASGTVAIPAPAGWTVSPPQRPFALHNPGEAEVVTFEVRPPAGQQSTSVTAMAQTGGNERIDVAVRRIDYPHLPLITLFPPARARLVRADAVTLAKRVGYIPGAGDNVAAALSQLGCSVTVLDPRAIATVDLSGYDAIVTGVRAYSERPELLANQDRLLNYVKNGGTLVVQYNRIERPDDQPMQLGPYPFKLSHDRVVEESAPVWFDAQSPLMTAPNKITEADFAGWLQERGLYFASEWDRRYETPLEMHDAGEKPHRGSLLVARYGGGVYIYTGLSLFRELPAGVPGAYRLFANLLSAAKSMSGEARQVSGTQAGGK